MTANAATVPPSKVVRGLIRFVARQIESGESCRVLVCGPPSGPTIEVFSGIGCRVTVEGERTQRVPLDYPDDTFELLLGFDQLDFLDDESARALVAEWRRVLRPGGRVYMLSRQNAGQMAAARLRVDVRTDGSLELRPSPDLADRPRKRSNRQIQTMLAPMAVDELYLRRDGLREISGKKRGSASPS
ncbi:MAG: class I SAM-dependent methyltransferase [Acidobacteriota bacterium]|nr:class I SAM-dependent methyltransferase [Acidobacteriota bacterium]